jgi:HK97 family phage portal protein
MGLFDRFLKKSPFAPLIGTQTIGRPEGNFPPIQIADPGTPLLSYAPGNSVYETELAVRDVISFIASNIASIPFKVYRKKSNGDREEADGTLLSDLLQRPNRRLTRYRLFDRLIKNGLIYDRWLCLLGDTVQGLELRPIPDRNFSLLGNTMDEIIGVRVYDDYADATNGTLFPYPESPAVVLDVGFSSSGVDGSPISDTLKPYLQLIRIMTEYRAAIGDNGGRIPAYISRDKDMPWPSREAQDAFVQGMRKYVHGGGSEGGWPLLNDGMAIHPVDAFKPIDMNDLEASEKIRISVANAFHISPENLGFRSGTNSNVSAFKEQLWNVELMPYIVAFEQALNHALPLSVPGSEGLYIEANIDAKLRGTLETQYAAFSTASGRPFLSTNDVRTMLNKPKVDGGDDIITPLNVTTGNQPSPQDGGRTQNAQTNTSPNGGSR